MGGEYITPAMLDRAIAAVGRPVQPGDAVLLRTGQEEFTMDDPQFYKGRDGRPADLAPRLDPGFRRGERAARHIFR